MLPVSAPASGWMSITHLLRCYFSPSLEKESLRTLLGPVHQTSTTYQQKLKFVCGPLLRVAADISFSKSCTSTLRSTSLRVIGPHDGISFLHMLLCVQHGARRASCKPLMMSLGGSRTRTHTEGSRRTWAERRRRAGRAAGWRKQEHQAKGAWGPGDPI